MQNRGRTAILVSAGLFGVAGIALAAAASHGSDPRLLGGASAMCLAHAPALIAIGTDVDLLRLGRVAAVLMVLGTLVFSVDLGLRHVAGHGLFPMSAPLGGILMMLGWLTVAIGALLPGKQA